MTQTLGQRPYERPPEQKAPLFAGKLVHLSASQEILPEQTAMSLADLQEIGKGRLADDVGRFLTKHFLKVEGQANGSIILSVNVTLLVSEVPGGLAHTTIVFKEVPREAAKG